MRIVVTGAAGFIGPYLVDRLLMEGHEIMGVDNLSTGDPNALKPYLQRTGFRFSKSDVRDFKSIIPLLHGCEVLFHLAAQTNIHESIRDPLSTNSVNVGGTLQVIRSSIESGVGRVVFPSSAAVYGIPSELPLKETSRTRPISPYGASKLAAEHYVNAFRTLSGLDAVILRIFNVYGPGQRYSPYAGVITRFVESIKQNKDPVIFGNGNQTRDFIFVGDCVEAMIRSMTEKKAKGLTLNIATGKPTSIKRLAEMLIRISGRRGLRVRFSPARSGDIKRSYADVTLARKTIGFSSSVSLVEGLSRIPLKT